MSKQTIIMIVGLAIVAVANIVLVAIPARSCASIGGQSVLGIGRVVCVQPYTPPAPGRRK